MQSIREASLLVNGAKLFNCLPKELRDCTGCKVDTFKVRLDKYIQTVPDQPSVPQYVAYRRALSNMLPDQISAMKNSGHGAGGGASAWP